MQLEVGKKYRTRDARLIVEITGRMKTLHHYIGNVTFDIKRIISAGKVLTYHETGYYFYYLDNLEPDDWDLVEEVTID